MSSLQVDNIQTYNSNPPVIKNVSGTEVGTFCRAWVNFSGTGVVAIRASFNVSSITDNGTGNYTVNFTTAMADANYATAVAVGNTVSSDYGCVNSYTSATVSVASFQTNGSYVDVFSYFVAIFR